MPTYEKQSRFDVDAPSLFAWHARPGALERLLPPWEHMRIVSRHGGITDGSRVTIEIRRGPFRLRWEALHRDFEDGRRFQDVQVAGPFRRWVHTHRVEPDGDHRSILIDHVDYALPLGPLGAMAAGLVGRSLLDRTFRFRHRRIATDLARHRQVGGGRRLRVVITGPAGVLLSQLAAFLSTGGHVVHVFPTLEAARIHPGHPAWGPVTVPDASALQQADAVVHFGLQPLPALLASLDERGSRARVVVALPTLDVPGTPALRGDDVEAALATGKRRVVALMTPGVLAAWPALEDQVPLEALTPSLDGPLVGLDDLIGATHFALCSDAVRGAVDVTLPRQAASAGLDAGSARRAGDVRLLRLLVPSGLKTAPLTAWGFEPESRTLATAILAELGWPEG